eukprot:scaffold35693_cov129-Isochrysis_galbana.AAC.1
MPMGTPSSLASSLPSTSATSSPCCLIERPSSGPPERGGECLVFKGHSCASCGGTATRIQHLPTLPAVPVCGRGLELAGAAKVQAGAEARAPKRTSDSAHRGTTADALPGLDRIWPSSLQPLPEVSVPRRPRLLASWPSFGKLDAPRFHSAFSLALSAIVSTSAAARSGSEMGLHVAHLPPPRSKYTNGAPPLTTSSWPDTDLCGQR